MPSASRAQKGACPLCGSSGLPYRAKAGYRGLSVCEQCAHVFATAPPRGSEQYNEEYFTDCCLAYEEFVSGRPHRWRTQFYTDLLQRIEGRTTGRHLLDIGCGVGEFIAISARRGWEPEGIDISAEACRIAARLTGRSIRCGVLTSQTFPPQSFDAVTAIDLLEHIADPRAMLHVAWQVLKQKGVLLIVTPNLNGISTRVFGPGNYALDTTGSGPGHLQFFREHTLCRLLESSGFVPTLTVTRDAYVHNLLLAFPRLVGRTAHMAEHGRRRQGRLGIILRHALQNSWIGCLSIAILNTVLLSPFGIGDQLAVIAEKKE